MKTGEGSGKRKDLYDQFLFREMYQEEIGRIIEIEQICFPPNEACSPESMKKRALAAPELFLAAVDRENGKIAGFLNGIASDERCFRDEFFTDISLHRKNGANVMLCGLDVLPEYRGRGLARELTAVYAKKERKKGRRSLILTCLPPLTGMYRKFGFYDRGKANSSWGGETWNEMDLPLKITTLCYIEQDGKWLMMNRNKKKDDYNSGKWIGVGGKLEGDETADECLLREVYEETGLILKEYRFLGPILFRSDQWGDEIMMLYLGGAAEGTLGGSCHEGTLEWIPKEKIMSLPMWEGDRYFIGKMLSGVVQIDMELDYHGEKLLAVKDYAPGLTGQPAGKRL